MKVLLCTPYKSDPDIVRGGINQWARNILSYYEERKDGIEIIPVSFDRHISLIYSKNILHRFINGLREQIRPLRNALNAIKNEKPDVIHICSSAGLGCLRDMLLVKAAKRYQVRSIVHLHFGRLPELAKKNDWEWRLLKSVIRKCDVVVPMNKPTETTLRKNGFSNVHYLPNPLSNKVIEQITELKGIERIPRQLLYVGHVYREKGVKELVEGCSKIDNIELRIVGKCSQEMRDELLSLSLDAKGKDWICFVGEMAHEDVLREFLSADMFVFPSYTEGFPNVILEAMACECPIVASNVGAIPEMLDIGNNPCGVCINPKSSEEVHDAVMSLLDDSKQKEEYANRAKSRVQSMYSMPVVWKELVGIWTSFK